MIFQMHILLIFQVYRRDSQDEIYAGSHQYPGQVSDIKKLYHNNFKTKKFNNIYNF